MIQSAQLFGHYPIVYLRLASVNLISPSAASFFNEIIAGPSLFPILFSYCFRKASHKYSIKYTMSKNLIEEYHQILES